MGFTQASTNSNGTTTVSSSGAGQIASISGPTFKGYDENGNALYTVTTVLTNGTSNTFTIDEDEVLYWATARDTLRAQSYQTERDVRDAEVHDSDIREYEPVDRSADEPLVVDPPVPVLLLNLPASSVVPLGQQIQLTFTPTACNIQWYEVGVGALPGETDNTLTLDFMLPEDAGRQFYAICWTDTRPDDGVLTTTTSLVVGPEVYDPYRAYASNFQMESLGVTTNTNYVDGLPFKAPINSQFLFVRGGTSPSGDYADLPDTTQDWTSTQFRNTDNSRFGAASLRINGLRDYTHWYGLDNGDRQQYYDFFANAYYTNPDSWNTAPEDHQGGIPPLFDQDFTMEGWFFSDYALTTLAEIAAAEGSTGEWQNWARSSNRGCLFSIGEPFDANRTDSLNPGAETARKVNLREGAIDPSSLFGHFSGLFSMPDGQLVWSSFYPDTEVVTGRSNYSFDYFLEHKVIVADLEPHNVRDGAWHFVSVTRRSGNIYIHVDGVLVGSGRDDTSYPAIVHYSSINGDRDHGKQAHTPFYIGQLLGAGFYGQPKVFTYEWNNKKGWFNDQPGVSAPNVYSQSTWGGDIDSFRYTPAKARYTSENYEVPGTQFHTLEFPVYGGEMRVPSPLGKPAVQTQVETGFVSAFVPIAGAPQIYSTSDTTVHGLLVPSPLPAPAAFAQIPANVSSRLSVPAPLFAPEGEVSIPLAGRLRVRSPLGRPSVFAVGQFDVKLDVRSALGAPSATVIGPIDSWVSSPSPLRAPAIQANVSAGVTVQETVYETAVITSAMYTDLVRDTVTDSAVITSAATIEASSKLLESATIASAAYPRQTIVVSYTDGAVINDTAVTDVRTVQLVTESAVISDIATLEAPRTTVTESAVISSALYAGRTHTVAVSDAAKIVARAYTPVRLTAVDGAVITDATYFQITSRVTTTDAAVITSAAYVEADAVATATESAVITANALLRVQAKATVTDEAFLYDTAYPVASLSGQPFGEQSAWTAHTSIWAMSRYATNDITGLAGRYAVAASGLYEQASTYASLSIQSGFLNFGSPSLKTTPAMYSYSTHASPMTIKVTADLNGAQNTYTYTEMARPAGDHRAVRTLFGKGLKSTYFKLGISSSGYTHVQYCVPVVQELSRRI